MRNLAIWLTILGIALAFGALKVEAQITFEPFVEYAAGDRPGAITTGDFNGDTILDLAVANFNGDDISIFPGLGDGTFAPTVNFEVGETPSSVTRCELNGDGRPDLVVANHGFGFDRISVLINETEDPNALAFSHTLYDSASRPIDIACGDLDGDGDQDLAVANLNSDDVFLFENNGNGLFDMRGSVAAERWPWAVKAVDLNGDGLPDLAVANNESNTVSVLINNPGNLASFQPQVSLPVGSRPDGLAAADLDGDGDTDLVTPNRGTSDVTVLRNDGSGVVYNRSDYDGDGGLLAVAVGDVSQDGRPDIVTANNSRSQATILPNDVLLPGRLLPFVDFPVASDPRGITLGDFNDDGRLDVAAANTNSRLVSILLNTTRRPPRGISCAALVTETTTLTAGVDDDFALPTEPAMPGVDLLPLCSNSKDFDASSTDDCFGHTFTDLPANIVSATLTVRMRADSSVPTNDSIQLGLHDGSFLWGRRIGTGGPFSGDVPGLSPDPWSFGTTQTFHFDLGALPDRQGTSTSILEVLNSSHILDVRVTDDTGVDFLSLQVKYCEEVRFGGLGHRPIAGTHLISDPILERLKVSGVDPVAGGGVEVDLGEAKGWGFTQEELDIFTDPIGAFKQWTMVGVVDGVPGQETWTERHEVVGSEAQPALQVSFDTSPLGATNNALEIYQGDRLVYRGVFPNGPLYQTETKDFPYEPPVLEQVWDSVCQVLPIVILPLSIKVQDGTVIDSFDRIVTYPIDPIRSVDSCSTVLSTVGGISETTLWRERLVAFEGRFAQEALGQAVFESKVDQLTLSNLGTSGDDGLTVHLDRADTFHMGWLDVDPADALPMGARMEIRSTGTLIGGGAEQDLGAVALTKTDDSLEITADFTPIDSPTQRLEIYDNGRLVEVIPGNSQPLSVSGVNGIVIWPIAADKIGGDGRTTCYVLTWPQDIFLETFNKGTVMGDEIRILAENQDEALAHLDSFTVQTAAIPELTIIDEGESDLALSCDDPTQLCLRQDRFQVEVQWQDFQGNSGSGRATALTQESGYFWFFQPDNAEIAIKVLDGRDINGHWWVFYGALSNVEYTVTVTDTQTGAVASYFNPSGRFFSVADTRALPEETPSAVRSVLVGTDQLPGLTVAADSPPFADSAPKAAAKRTCASTSEALCLNGNRFLVEVEWEDFQGNTGTETAVSLTNDSGYFWFFQPGNVELVVKVLDGRTVTGHWWVFYASLSNVAYTITVTDTETNTVRTYVNPLGQLQSRGDTRAFP
jgi:hypothetical protein